MHDLGQLYQELIIDHSRNPRCQGKLDGATHQHEGFNPICGDRVCVFIRLKQNTLDAIAFEGSGCAICMASSSLMCEALQHKTCDELQAYWTDFHHLMQGKTSSITGNLGKIAALEGVSAYPMRIKCATLPWHTIQAALSQTKNAVSTKHSSGEVNT